MDISQKFRNVIRAIVGLPEDPGQAPQIDRLAWYEAQVTACASDGSTCDVQPADSRISGENGVTVLVGIPGLTAVVQPGARVMLGWERGDPGKPRVIPIWQQGATVTKMTISATALELAGNAYALPQWDPFIAVLAACASTIAGLTTATDPATVITLANGIKAAFVTLNTALGANSNYKSLKVKNG